VVRIDGDPVGSGVPGPLSRRLRECYLAHAAAAA
jgi:D-alanine transaminase